MQWSYCDVKFHHYSFGCGWCSFKRCQHLLPTLCWRVSNATAGAVDRKACHVPSSSHFCAPMVSCSHWARGTDLFLCCRYSRFWQQQQVGPMSFLRKDIFAAFWCGLQETKFPCLAFLVLLRPTVTNSFVYDVLEESQRKAEVQNYMVSFKKSGGWWSIFGNYAFMIAQGVIRCTRH